jgi:hypothetical protein
MDVLGNKGEVIIYQPDDKSTMLEVRIEDETVWLTQMQMAELFQTTRNNITLHIGNLFKENELAQISVCKDSLLTAQDGKQYKTKLYNLDVIISIGYHVKSHIGASLKDIGKKWFAFSRIELDASEMIKRLNLSQQCH